MVSTIADRVISAEVRRRTWRVQVLQNRIAAMLALSEARAAMYADQKEGVHEFQVNTLAEERAAIDRGCHALPPADGKEGSRLPRPAYPKTMVHPGYPNGAATGLLVKDYRGKDANQEVWKFDSALEARLAVRRVPEYSVQRLPVSIAHWCACAPPPCASRVLSPRRVPFERK